LLVVSASLCLHCMHRYMLNITKHNSVIIYQLPVSWNNALQSVSKKWNRMGQPTYVPWCTGTRLKSSFIFFGLLHLISQFCTSLIDVSPVAELTHLFAENNNAHSRGVERILHWGLRKLNAEGDRIEAPKAPRRVGIAEGVSPPLPTRRSGGASWSPQRGPRRIPAANASLVIFIHHTMVEKNGINRMT